MPNAFDVRLDDLTGASARADRAHARSLSDLSAGGERTFYIETFGCQMNDHDSEKVAGVLLGRGYQQVETVDAAKLVLYNTCSIREKAAQKVFSRLGTYRKHPRPRENYRRAGLRRAAGRRRNFRARALGEPGVRLGELQQAAGTDRGTGIGKSPRDGPR